MAHFPSIIPWINDMLDKDVDRDHFYITFATIRFDVLVCLDTEPYEMLIGARGLNWACTLTISQNFEMQMDDYDFYLWGARALLTIQNPECHNGKKLLLFRDSFGSGIAPLLAEYYEEVTLVDLRYVSASYALELLGDTEYQDVLFLYSAPILNHGDSLRFG